MPAAGLGDAENVQRERRAGSHLRPLAFPTGPHARTALEMKESVCPQGRGREAEGRGVLGATTAKARGQEDYKSTVFSLVFLFFCLPWNRFPISPQASLHPDPDTLTRPQELGPEERTAEDQQRG